MDAAAPRHPVAGRSMTSAWLAWRTMRRYRARTALATIGVAIIGALLFDMLLLSRGLVTSFADLLNHSGYDIRVLNSQGFSLSRASIPRAVGCGCGDRALAGGGLSRADSSGAGDGGA